MGNDGGSIPKRRELVKEAARNPTTTELKESRENAQEYAWTTDPLSRRPLVAPIVSDCTGRLFNKDAVLEYLLNPSTTGGEAAEVQEGEGLGNAGQGAEKVLRGNVKSLKDVVEVRFEQDDNGRWVCPVTRKELGPRVKACYIIPCGHAFAEAGIREVKGNGGCVQCELPYVENDVIPIFSTDELEIARLSSRMDILRGKGLTHALKKAPNGEKKKKRKHAAASADAAPVSSSPNPVISTTSTGTTARSQPQSAPSKIPTTTSQNIKNPATASLTQRVLDEQNQKFHNGDAAKRRRLHDDDAKNSSSNGKRVNDNIASLFSSRDQNKPNAHNKVDFMTRGYTIPTDARR